VRRYVLSLVLALGLISPAAIAAAEGSHTAVVLIGGIGSQYLTTGQAFDQLSGSLLRSNLGYRPGDVIVWSYDPSIADYDPSLTCRPLADNAASLADSLRWLRDTQGYSNVVLVGHSMGGLIAYDMVDPTFEFVDQGFLKKIVTIDSPLLGVGSGRALLGDVWQDIRQGSNCAAIGQLEYFNQLFRAGSLHVPNPRGVPVLSIANDADNAVPFISQTAAGWIGQHWDYTLSEGWGLVNHAATLHNPGIMAGLAQWIGPQGQ
jgi:pimeloyl-ACP methyl ester carboxylesterase